MEDTVFVRLTEYPNTELENDGDSEPAFTLSADRLHTLLGCRAIVTVYVFVVDVS